MHPFEWNQLADAFAPHRFQSTAGIAHAVFREPAPDEVRHLARDALHESVFALGAITADQIGAALDFGEQLWNVCRIVLEIAIDQYRRRAPRILQTSVHGRALTGVAFKLDDTDPRLDGDALNGRIGRAVIDENDFVIDTAQGGGELGLEDWHVLLFVKQGHNDRDLGRTSIHSGRVR